MVVWDFWTINSTIFVFSNRVLRLKLALRYNSTKPTVHLQGHSNRDHLWSPNWRSLNHTDFRLLAAKLIAMCTYKYPSIPKFSITHRIYVWYIYLHLVDSYGYLFTYIPSSIPTIHFQSPLPLVSGRVVTPPPRGPGPRKTRNASIPTRSSWGPWAKGQ